MKHDVLLKFNLSQEEISTYLDEGYKLIGHSVSRHNGCQNDHLNYIFAKEIEEPEEIDFSESIPYVDLPEKCKPPISFNEEREVVAKSMMTFGGSFGSHLGHALQCADPSNARKIKRAFIKDWEHYKDVWLNHKPFDDKRYQDGDNK